MRTIDAPVLALMNDHRYVAVHLFAVYDGASDYFWTDAPHSVAYDGDTYTQRAFAVGPLIVGVDGEQVVEILMTDIDKVIRGLLYAESWSYRPAVLMEAYLDADGAVVGVPTVLADGRADAGSVDLIAEDEPVTISLLPEHDAEGAAGPSQEYSSSCRYAKLFKGEQCGYVGGETTCDGSWTQCGARSNTARFGGFRFSPKPGAKITLSGGTLTLGVRE